MSGIGRAAVGSLAGAGIAAAIAPLLRPLFDPPSGGVGVLTVTSYPKGWDYAVIALLVIGACAGGLLALVRERKQASVPDVVPIAARRPRLQYLAAAVVFVVMLFVHDHPYAHMDPFHEGEHLTPAFLFHEGARPYRDVFVLHGLGTDGGLDALVMGDASSPLRTRRLQTFIDAATLALLAPIAAEVAATTAGFACGLLLSLCGVAAFWVPVFPYFRFAPVLLATLALLRYVRNGRARSLFLAFASGTLGVLWSLDVGTYALAGTTVAFILLRALQLEPKPLPPRRVAAVVFAALLLPFLVLIAVRADVRQFFADSFVIIPRAIDAVWSLPAPAPFTANGVRYYLPPIVYGFLLAIAWKRRDARMLIVVVLSIIFFRTAAGRVSWSHTRFAVPLLGIAIVAFIIERTRSRIVIAALAIASIFYFEVPQNLVAGGKLIAGWPARQRHEGMVRHPLARGIYTTEQNATELSTLKGYIDALGDGAVFDFTNERALYFLLKRKPPVRCFDVPMLSAPPLLHETMTSLAAHPPIAVILGGEPTVAVFDGVSNRDRVPQLARWIDENYPRRTQIGRFIVATR